MNPVKSRGKTPFARFAPFTFFIFFTCSLSRAAPAQPDIVVLLLDSLRADHLGCNGYPKPTSPVMDGVARAGANFTRAFAPAPWTQPSVMSLFTSVLPDAHGRVSTEHPHDAGLATLAGVLQQAGYQTVGLTANRITHRKYGFAKGFDHYDDHTVAMALDAPHSKGSAMSATSPTLTRLAEGVLARRDPDRPLFLFILYMDTHWDYQPPPAYYRMFTDDPVPARGGVASLNRQSVTPAERARIIAAYDGEIRHTDTHVGLLLEAIEASPRGGDTVLAICSDHGEAFWEHGMVTHANSLYDEELHVPLILRAPASAAPARGVEVGVQVSLLDLAPTLLDFAGIPPPASWQGRSLRPFLGGGAVSERPLALDLRAYGRAYRGVRTSRHKIIARPPYATPFAAYDLKADPGEQNNLVKRFSRLPAEVAPLLPLLPIQNHDGKQPAK